MPTKKGQAPADLRYFAKKSVGQRALETHLRHEPTPPTGCQALRVSIERALGDDAAVRIASAPGMITGGAASLETTRYIATAPKAAITDTAALFGAQAEPRVQGNVAR